MSQKILDIEKVRNTLADFPDDEKKIINLRNTAHSVGGIPGKRGNPNFLCVNEPGLYRLIFMSRKPAAEKFKRWVFHEVLPQIRKYGYYGMTQEEIEEAELEAYWAEVERQIGERSDEYFEDLKKILPYMTDEEKLNLPDDPRIIVYRVGSEWKVNVCY